MRKVNLRNVDPAIDDPDASTWCKCPLIPAPNRADRCLCPPFFVSVIARHPGVEFQLIQRSLGILPLKW